MPDRIKLVITISKRGAGDKFVDHFKEQGLHYNFVCQGLGTANSEILDCLGLESNEKDVIITPVPESQILYILKSTMQKFKLSSPGRGIMFSIPINAVSARVSQMLCKAEPKKEVSKMEENNRKYELVLAIANKGCTDDVINAAKSVGARGGTVLRARRVAYEEVENMFGFSIQPEKEIIAILTQTEMRSAIMKKIAEEAGINSEARAILLCLPVDDFLM